MAFEEYDRSYDHSRNVRAEISIRRDGIMALNYAAQAVLERPAHIKLYYDRPRHLIGIQATGSDDPNAYPMHYPEMRGRDDKTGNIYAAGFLRRYNVPHEHARRYYATYEPEERMLLVDVRNGQKP